MIVKAKFVALDSSHWDAWVRDASSAEEADRQRAAAFESALLDLGFVIVVTGHHLIELVKHGEDSLAERRFDFILKRPLLAWPKHADGSPGLGLITDLLAAESQVACEVAGATALVVRDRLASRLLSVGPGADALRTAGPWLYLRPLLAEEAERTRETVAISRSKFVELSKTKLHDLMRRELRSPEAQAVERQRQEEVLAHDIATRGDKNIADPKAAAAAFMRQIAESTPPISSTMDAVLRPLFDAGLRVEDISPKTTVGDASALAELRSKLKTVMSKTGQPWASLVNLTADQLPSQVITRNLDRYRQDEAEWKGSDLPDAYMAAFAPYIDVLFVDKRTRENFRRAAQHSDAFRSLIHKVEKAATYDKIPKLLTS